MTKAITQHNDTQGLDIRVAKIESDVGSIKDRVSEIGHDVRALNSQLNTRTERLETKIDRVRTELTSRIDNIRIQLNGRIDKLGDRVSALPLRLLSGTAALLAIYGFINHLLIK